MKDTSWRQVGKWYDELVSKEGHYYHREVIFPLLFKWLDLKKSDSLLDLACGQGVLSRILPEETHYVGVDLAKPLIEKAKKYTKETNHSFVLNDITRPLNVKKTDFTHATIILALQNIKEPLKALKNTKRHLKDSGTLTLILNHPCFRIPRQSSWGVDEKKQCQYRRIDSYLSTMEIPIQMNPGKGKDSKITFSYHYSLSTLTKFLSEAGFAITRMEELCSNKRSTGKKKKMEDRARSEFPLFLAIQAKNN